MEFLTKPRIILSSVASFILIIILIVFLANRPPTDFPTGTVVTIEKGESLKQVSQDLVQRKIIRSALLLRMAATINRGEHGIVEGEYFFKNPISAFVVAKKIISGDYAVPKIKVTIPEGLSRFEIADRLNQKLDHFDSKTFLTYTFGKEGYLFPDTYFIPLTATTTDVARILENEFTAKIETIKPEITAFGKPLSDVVTMASILEGEARQTETRKIIAGILWHRLKVNMPLQVDATFSYVNGKNSFTLSGEDLKIDSPYNTYKYSGLPPTPISNPGLDAIEAAVTPTKTPYLYFLTDKNGVMHYAKTFAEHLKNKLTYLND